ncbi:MAG TPA: hypothetical protein VJU84_08790 [Pyrinomonadaceae bacterium]|nr:hypothetical protein [Pyrinomonadaceae bacterium]
MPPAAAGTAIVNSQKRLARLISIAGAVAANNLSVGHERQRPS